jgi:hypothetical protein
MSRDEDAGLGCLLLIVIAICFGGSFFSCCSNERAKQREHEFKMEQLRLEHERKGQ